MALGDLAQLLRSANGNLFAKTKTPYSLNQVLSHLFLSIQRKDAAETNQMLQGEFNFETKQKQTGRYRTTCTRLLGK